MNIYVNIVSNTVATIVKACLGYLAHTLNIPTYFHSLPISKYGLTMKNKVTAFIRTM